MGQGLLLLVVALTVAAVVFGVTVLVSGRDPGLAPAEPDDRAVPLPGDRPLRESDVGEVRFDTALRGYRMAQVDQAMRRAAYDIGYKTELIGVLEAEVAALRAGRTADADALRRSREQAAGAAAGAVPVDGAATPTPAGVDVASPPEVDVRAAGTVTGPEPSVASGDPDRATTGPDPDAPGTGARAEVTTVQVRQADPGADAPGGQGADDPAGGARTVRSEPA
ncbi:DivIVA domain-containing protein [Micromonospora nigra]|uniref:DivIVA domain-containing protein n=1 Tax=Micromonospora nigra TaxID=145857 RepID=A0A1C6SBN1_9ACTN|nr:DivIVA domain-containing protein [Micromonospora nigra]SCL26692.1 DivIVA domain-containing protein [Micromonospora nigra]